MPLDVLKKFLVDPCLRVTPSCCQNDPFEFGFSETDLQELDSVSESKRLGEDLKSFSNLHGIISLTTSESNILMWSHYSKNHTGAVIELIIDEERPESLFINSTGENAREFVFSDFIFDKVNYKNERTYENTGTFSDIELIKKHYYFTKAEQWTPEDEYRFITPLNWINRILLTHKGFKNVKRILGGNSEGIICQNINEPEKYRKYELSPSYIDKINALSPNLLFDIWNASNENEIMFFIRLNSGVPGSGVGNIGKIYLGCQADVDSFITELKSGDNLHQNYYDIFSGNIRNVLIGEIDKNKYKLVFNELALSI